MRREGDASSQNGDTPSKIMLNGISTNKTPYYLHNCLKIFLTILSVDNTL